MINSNGVAYGTTSMVQFPANVSQKVPHGVEATT